MMNCQSIYGSTAKEYIYETKKSKLFISAYTYIRIRITYVCHFYLSVSHITFINVTFSLLLRRWYEIIELYYVESILTYFSASRQDKGGVRKIKMEI